MKISCSLYFVGELDQKNDNIVIQYHRGRDEMSSQTSWSICVV